MQGLTFCFVASNDYVDRLHTLIESIAHHLSTPATYVVMSCETPGQLKKELLPYYVNILELHHVIPNYQYLMARYHPKAHISGIGRVHLVSHLLNAGHDKVIYLDSDMMCYADLKDLEVLLDNYEALVTPHITEPYLEDGKAPSMENIVRCGNYNTGFIGARSTPSTKNFFKWWVSMCEEKADVDYAKAHYSEQNWLRFIGDFTPHTLVLQHSGYNLANWNFYQRGLRNENGKWMTKDGPLYLAHFSSLCHETEWVSCNQNRHKATPSEPIYDLVESYKSLFPHRRWPHWGGGWVT